MEVTMEVTTRTSSGKGPPTIRTLEAPPAEAPVKVAPLKVAPLKMGPVRPVVVRPVTAEASSTAAETCRRRKGSGIHSMIRHGRPAAYDLTDAEAGAGGRRVYDRHQDPQALRVASLDFSRWKITRRLAPATGGPARASLPAANRDYCRYVVVLTSQTRVGSLY